MRKSSKKVLEAGFKLVKAWAESPDWQTSVLPLIIALREYDPEKFFAHYELGIKRGLELLKSRKEN